MNPSYYTDVSEGSLEKCYHIEWFAKEGMKLCFEVDENTSCKLFDNFINVFNKLL